MLLQGLQTNNWGHLTQFSDLNNFLITCSLKICTACLLFWFIHSESTLYKDLLYKGQKVNLTKT